MKYSRDTALPCPAPDICTSLMGQSSILYQLLKVAVSGKETALSFPYLAERLLLGACTALKYFAFWDLKKNLPVRSQKEGGV